MNIIEQQNHLKHFSDEQLVGEMQSPSGQAPQFLVLTELNRRNRMKKEYEAALGQKEQGTVADRTVAERQGLGQFGDNQTAMGMAIKANPDGGQPGFSGSNEPQMPARGYADGGLIGSDPTDTPAERLMKSVLGRTSVLPWFEPDSAATGIATSIGDFFTGQPYVDEATAGLAGLDKPGPPSRAEREAVTYQPTDPREDVPVEPTDANVFDRADAGAMGIATPPGVSQQAPVPQKSIQDEILKILQSKESDAKKQKEVNKWLALAQAGFTMASSTLPFGAAVGQGGLAGIQALQQGDQSYNKAIDSIVKGNVDVARLRELSRQTDAQVEIGRARAATAAVKADPMRQFNMEILKTLGRREGERRAGPSEKDVASVAQKIMEDLSFQQQMGNQPVGVKWSAAMELARQQLSGGQSSAVVSTADSEN